MIGAVLPINTFAEGVPQGTNNTGLVGTAPLPPVYIERTLTMQKNDALSNVLNRAGISAKQSFLATKKLKNKVALGKMKAGDKVLLTYKLPNAGEYAVFNTVKFNAPYDKIAKVTLVDGKFMAHVVKRQLKRHRAVAVGHIAGSLYHSANKAGLPDSLVTNFANLFAYELDFTRDIRRGDLFKVVFEKVLDAKGNYVRSGNILAAEVYTKGRKRTAFRFKDSHGHVEYYDENGKPKRKLLLRTPLEFTRISSNFNLRRKHPVLGYTRAHKGTDFAAPTGTPIKSSGSGKIEFVGWHGAHGKYIKVKHNRTYSTAYAHLSRYARGLKKGARIKQGQIIGYVGTTGRSTGPHLHYEVHKNGVRVNAMRAKLPAGNPLHKSKRKIFQTQVASLKSMWAGIGVRVASVKKSEF